MKTNGIKLLITAEFFTISFTILNNKQWLVKQWEQSRVLTLIASQYWLILAQFCIHGYKIFDNIELLTFWQYYVNIGKKYIANGNISKVIPIFKKM